MKVTLTLTAPYRRCTCCGHPGPPLDFDAVSLIQAEDGFDLIPHLAGCAWPNPLGTDMSTIKRGAEEHTEVCR